MMKLPCKGLMLPLLGVSLSLFTMIANSSGFRIPETSVAGIGASDALVASIEPGALPYNPAAMAFQKGTTLVLGSTVFFTDYNVVPDGGTSTDSLSDVSPLVPSLSYAKRLNNDKFAIGVNATSPFGLDTEWPDNTFPGFGGVDAAEPSLNGLKMINLNPNVSYLLNETTSVALGIDIYSVLEANLDTHAIDTNSDGTAVGWNAAFLFKNGRYNLGLSYRSAVNMDLDGTLTWPGVLTAPISSEIEFPEMIQLGARYKLKNLWEVEFDIDFEGWSSFDRVVLTNASSGAVISANTFNWEDTLTYRMSANRRITDKMLLRFGGGYAQSPVTGDARFAAPIPGGDRWFISVGLQLESEAWVMTLGYLYSQDKDIGYRSSTLYSGGDPNGTEAYNGLYRFRTHVLGMGIQKHF